VATPKEAIVGGADYLVVGRPVLDAESRTGMLEKIFAEVRDGLALRKSQSCEAK